MLFNAVRGPFWLLAFSALGLLALSWVWPEVALGGGILLLALLLPGLLISPWFCAQAVALFLFTGILLAVKVGFSLKAAQLFALLALPALGYAVIQAKTLTQLSAGLWPLAVIPLSWMPSLAVTESGQLALDQEMTGIRLILNYALLQVITVCLFWAASTRVRIQRLTHLLLGSCVLSLLVGWAQQIGFYTGLYNPLDYLGRHSALVDFYGPFLRIAPGTFANEYGEILQSMGLVLVGLLYLPSHLRTRRQRLTLFVLLAWVVASLVINFTRASWLVFVTGTFILLALGRPPLRRLLLLGGMLYGIFGGLFRLSQLISEAGLLISVGQRFGELSDVTVESAGQRLDAWGQAWQRFLESPWIGQGLGRFVDTHNVPLQLLAETGLLGLVTFYAVMVWALYTMYTAWREAREPELKSLQIIWLLTVGGCLAFDLTNHGIFHFVLWGSLALGLATARVIRAPLSAATVSRDLLDALPPAVNP